jgi:hypothetical protein
MLTFSVTGKLFAGIAEKALVMFTVTFGGSAPTTLAQPPKNAASETANTAMIERCIFRPKFRGKMALRPGAEAKNLRSPCEWHDTAS